MPKASSKPNKLRVEASDDRIENSSTRTRRWR